MVCQHFDGLSNKRYTTVAQFRLNSRINEVLWILAHWLCQWCFISLLVDYKLHYEKSQRLRRRPMVTWPQGLSMYDVMKREGTWKWKVIKREKKKRISTLLKIVVIMCSHLVTRSWANRYNTLQHSILTGLTWK